MSIELNWHASLPILIGTYPDSVTPKTYVSMCKQRRKLLSEQYSAAVLLLDMQHLTEVRDAHMIDTDNLLYDGQVVRVVVVLATDLFERVVRSRTSKEISGFSIQFFDEWAPALDEAERLATDLVQ